MSGTPKKRSWFQFHLSTLIILQFVAAGLLWANLPKSRSQVYIVGMVCDEIGWPWRGLYWVVDYHFPNDHGEFVRRSDVWWLVADFGVALAILFAVAVFCEWRIGRKAARRP